MSPQLRGDKNESSLCYQNTWRGKTPGFIRGDALCAARVSLAELLNFLASLTFGS